VGEPVSCAGTDQRRSGEQLLSNVLGVAPLGVVERSHLGDIEVGAKVLLFDSFGGVTRARSGQRTKGFRLAVGGLARLGTGQTDRPNELADVAPGTARTDVEGNGALDMVFGRRLWGIRRRPHRRSAPGRTAVAHSGCPAQSVHGGIREQTVTRDLGDYMEFEASPRYVYNDYISLSLHWRYRRKAEDKYTGTFTVDGPEGVPVVLDASILGVGTEQTEQRIGGGASFSTLSAFDRGRAASAGRDPDRALADDERIGIRPEAIQYPDFAAILHAVCSARPCARRAPLPPPASDRLTLLRSPRRPGRVRHRSGREELASVRLTDLALRITAKHPRDLDDSGVAVEHAGVGGRDTFARAFRHDDVVVRAGRDLRKVRKWRRPDGARQHGAWSRPPAGRRDHQYQRRLRRRRASERDRDAQDGLEREHDTRELAA
jgi:hypothetical protein